METKRESTERENVERAGVGAGKRRIKLVHEIFG